MTISSVLVIPDPSRLRNNLESIDVAASYPKHMYIHNPIKSKDPIMNPDFLNMKEAAEEAMFESVEAEQEQDEPNIKRSPRGYRHGNTKTLKSPTATIKRVTNRKAQRKARRQSRG